MNTPNPLSESGLCDCIEQVIGKNLRLQTEECVRVSTTFLKSKEQYGRYGMSVVRTLKLTED